MASAMTRAYGLTHVVKLLAFLGVILSGSSVASSQTPTVTAVRATLPLMQNWKFTQDDKLTDQAALASTATDWQTVSLPHTWNAQDAASLNAADYKRGIGWYRLEFPTPATGARHWLEIGAASLVADVWLNGKHLGQHKGAFGAFRFDVTTTLVPEGGNNVLLIKVNNTAPAKDSDLTAIPPMRGDFNVSGGLYRYVSLITTPDPVHFELGDFGGPGVYATTTSIANGTVSVRAKLKSDAKTPGEYLVRVSMLDAAGQLAATIQRNVSIGAGAAAEVTQELTVPNPHLWQGTADPYLYQLVAEVLRTDGTPVDKLAQPFGIREFRFDPNQGTFLNGKPVRLNGVGMHQDLLGKAWAITDADLDNSLAVIREMGANAVRYAHYPYSWHAYQKASELGLTVWAEAALGIYTTVQRCTKTQPTPVFVESAKQQLQEMIRQHYNHASIAMWAVGNESTQGQLNCDQPFDNVRPLLKQLHELAKAEDPARATAYAEFPHPVDRTGVFATEGITDLFATNRYFLWYTPEFEEFSPLLDAFHKRTPDQPIGVSEYGSGAALTHHTDNVLGGYPEIRSAPTGEVSYQPEEYAAYLHEQNYSVIASKPYLFGSFIWNMFDFGSAHRNEGDVTGVNTKGLVAFDHKTRKDPFYFYKANWSPEPTTYIVGRRYTDRLYPVTDVKVYSNADSVQLMMNGAPVGTMTANQCAQRACVFRNVRLSPGVNTVTATGTHAGTTSGDTVEWSLNTADIHIAAGRLASGYTSTKGTRFGSDNFFVGGAPGPTPRDAAAAGLAGIGSGGAPDVHGTKDPLLYKYFRHGKFDYDIPLADGAYRITLGFMEPNIETAEGDRTGTGSRVFNVLANGRPLLENFDIVEAAGDVHTVVTRSFTVRVTGGRLVLSFVPLAGDAIVSTIKADKQG